MGRSEDYGVPVRMITGDHLLIAKKTCRDLQMGDTTAADWPNIQGPDDLPRLDENGKPPANLVDDYGAHIRSADGFAQVWPEHKFLIVECYRQMGFKCGMTGDGVNDAPALKRADVGIAVAGATDAARAAADIVLTQEGLSTIVLGMQVSRVIFKRMKSFLTYRCSVSLYILLTFFIAVFAFEPQSFLPSPAPPEAMASEWPTFFQLPVLLLIIITILNDGTIISIGYDNAQPSETPERWLLPVLWLISTIMALWATFVSLILIYVMLDSWNDVGLFQLWGLGGLTYGQVISACYMQVSITAFLTLFCSRTQERFFFTSAPHWVLSIAACIALLVSTMLGVFWPCGSLDKVPICGLSYRQPDLLPIWILIYCFVMFVIQDIFKVGTFWILHRFNLFNIRGEQPSHHDIPLHTLPSSSS